MRIILKAAVLIFTCISVISCSFQKQNRIEIIASLMRSDWDSSTNQKVPKIFIELYAQIDNKGNCKVLRIPNAKVSKFSSFKIEEELFYKLNNSLSKVVSDSVISKYQQPCICDGPEVSLFLHEYEGKSYKVKYVLDKGTDIVYSELYRFIDSLSCCNNKEFNFDSSFFLNEREIRIDKLKADKYKAGFPQNIELQIVK